MAFALSAVMSECKAKAQQVTKDWTLSCDREGLTVGFDKENFLFELSLEYEGGETEKFSAPMAFSYLHPLQYGDFTLTFGGGVGFLLELQWKTEDYDIIGYDIAYPDLNTETWFYVQTYVSLDYDVFIITFKTRVSDDWIHPVLGGGFKW